MIAARDGGSGLGAGMVLGILIALLAIGFAVWYFGFGGAGNRMARPMGPPTTRR